MKPLSCLLLLLVVGQAIAQVPLNGSFENGLNNWTVGGAARVDSLSAAAFNNQIMPTDGARFAFVSNGPGNVGGPMALIDGNGLTDSNISTLSTTLTFDFFPAVIRFDWAFASSEEDQGFNFDDIFDVQAGGVRILSGSSNKPGGASNFPDAPVGIPPQINVGGGGVTAGTNLRFGISAFNNLCVAVPGAAPGNNAIPLIFRVADQTDTTFDSGLLVDNVSVSTNCGTPGTFTLREMTFSSNNQVEVKDGALVVRQAQNRSPAVSSDGTHMVFIANADYGGGNPFFQEQAYLLEGGAFTRLTNFTGDEVQAVEVSADGDWAVAAARMTPTDNLEIFRINLGNGAITTITNTSNCDNTSPSINDNGRRIAFLSTCGAELVAGFNADANREMVLWNNGAFIVNETTACQSFRPKVNSLNSGRFVAFASNCDYTGGNGDNNLEVFRYQRNDGTFLQLTNTAIAGAVLDPVDISLDGRFVVFVAQDAGGRHVVFRFDATTGINTFQGVSRPDRLIIGVSLINTIDGNDIFYEALDLAAFPPAPSTLIGHIDVPTQIVSEGAANNSTLGFAAARIGAVPHVYFSVSDDLVGMNGDTNLEIFEGRVE